MSVYIKEPHNRKPTKISMQQILQRRRRRGYRQGLKHVMDDAETMYGFAFREAFRRSKNAP